MTKSNVHIQEKTAEAEKTKKDDEQNHQFHLRHRQCVKYYLYLKNENSFMKFASSFASSFNILKRNTQSKIETVILSFQQKINQSTEH